MPDREDKTTGPGPGTSPPDSTTGLVDPRSTVPAPEILGDRPAGSTGPETNEAPDVDTPAWEGPDPDDRAAGLVDPRAEARGPTEP